MEDEIMKNRIKEMLDKISNPDMLKAIYRFVHAIFIRPEKR